MDQHTVEQRQKHCQWGNMDQIDKLLENCDYIVNVLPSTPLTKYLLGGNTLSPAKKRQPVLINAGRGDIISEKDLITALDNGWISHAILDVYEQEPLCKESSLWNHPKVTLTPHVATFSTGADVVPVFLENLRRKASNEPLLYSVDFDKAY